MQSLRLIAAEGPREAQTMHELMRRRNVTAVFNDAKLYDCYCLPQTVHSSDLMIYRTERECKDRLVLTCIPRRSLHFRAERYGTGQLLLKENKQLGARLRFTGRQGIRESLYYSILLLLRSSFNVSIGLDETSCRKQEVLARAKLPHQARA